MPNPFHSKRHLLMTVDPVHVGTGGYRLGRVDNTIVREPGTNLPKIPGTSLSGVLRAYMAMRRERFPDCAGQGQADDSTDRSSGGHCGRHDCPVCVSFGFSQGNNSFQGLAQLSDALIVLFPVYSLLGPVWVTCPQALAQAGSGAGAEPPGDREIVLCEELAANATDRCNLGWLLLAVATSRFAMPSLGGVPDGIRQRSALVSDTLFSHIVNDNLETRTSVAIDPETGAADDGALFAFEAIPRSTVLFFDATVSDPAPFLVPSEEGACLPAFSAEQLANALTEAADYLEPLGIGGMNTRGMGRVRLLNREGAWS